MDRPPQAAEMPPPTPAEQGAAQAAEAQAAAEAALRSLPDVPAAAKPSVFRALWMSAHYAEAESVGSLAEIGRYCALHNLPGAFLNQFGRVATDGDRLELLHQHRLWGEQLERAAAQRPIARPSGPRDKGRIRVGFLSSDLRHHVVGYFAQPLFRHLDPRFELYCYSSFDGPPDVAQQWIASRVSAYRFLPADDRAAAEMIAADQLDILLDLGGPTLLNRPGVLAYRAAPRQASWLGYPHSLGLASIDGLIADPYLVPPRPDFLLEAPMRMPSTWICMAPAAFKAEPAVDGTSPADRNGYVTFGTANGPHKFNPRLLRTWARILAATPGSRFMFIRPEAGSRSFQENFARSFAEAGVSADRLVFRAVRGGVLPLYNEIDIALDPFPLTGGTSTCEALWMGVPVVTLVGEALFERMGWSLLNNVGLPELTATSVEDYVRIAVGLADSPVRLSELRRTMRERILAHPLGRPDQFARDFYDLIAATVAHGRPQP